mgnify:CR=1 FL=1
MDEAALLALDGAANDQLGVRVALSADGGRALVGAYLDDTAGGVDAGSARVFVRTGAVWSEEVALFASSGAALDGFGYAVSLSSDGSRALVGAIYDDLVVGAEAGSALVFARAGTTWVEEATLLASAGAATDLFGGSVALSADGSRALVGAYADDTVGGTDAGSARVFLRAGTTWVEEATLVASGGAAYDSFGQAVALSPDGSRALVGAYLDDTAGGADSGSVQTFFRTGATWEEEATLLDSQGATGDQFGQAVAVNFDGTLALVGARSDDTADGVDAGSAVLFRRLGTRWVEETRLLSADGAADDHFGESVALSADGTRALVGAQYDDTVAGPDAGSAWVFLLTPP